MNKTLVALILGLVISVCAQGQKSRITAHVQQASLREVFDLIQQQSEYIIFYNDKQVDLSQKVKVNAEAASVEDVLEQALRGTGLSYRIFDRQVIILRERVSADQANADVLGPADEERPIEGWVSEPNGNPIPGVSVVVAGWNTGMTTDAGGQYRLMVPRGATTLRFSFVGMKTREVAIGRQSRIDVVLQPDDIGVPEVIVSALGIRREEKSLSYSTQTINFNEIGNRESSFVSSLSGSVSGMEISRSASGAGGSSKVLLRGNKSLSGLSEPLFVIDGIPIANNKGRQLGLFDGSDQGDGLSQINPDDIESITVLKGANAAALYGSQGANGVILINTKRGAVNQLTASFSSYLTVESIQKTPDLQFRYGAEGGAVESWSYTKGNYPDTYVGDFFRTGTNLLNTITLSGGNERTSSYFSASNNTVKGVMPKNRYERDNISFKQNTKLLDGALNLGSSVIVTNEQVRNRNLAGYYLNPLTGLYFFPRNRDFASFKTNYQYFDADRNMYLQNWFVEDHFQSNPYWIIHNETREDQIKRLIGSVNAGYNFSPKLKVEVRGSYDYATKTYEEKHLAGSNITNVHKNGRWVYAKLTDELIYGDALLFYSEEFGKLRVSTLLGGSYEKTTFGHGISVDSNVTGLIYPNEFFFQNLDPDVMVSSVLASRMIKSAVFGNAQLGYDEKVYLEFSGRNDWASSLYGTGNDSYFYPSVGLTALASELIPMPEVVNFGKLRASFARVSNEVPFNRINPQNTITSSGGIDINTTQSFENLRPEKVQSFEFGTDWKLFKSRVGIDFTWYSLVSRDQFIELPAPSGSGYTTYFVNAGKIVNRGTEITLSAIPVQTGALRWKTVFNYADNRNRIVRLHPNLKEPIVLSESEGYELIIKEGGSFGDIYVHKFLRDSEGRIRLNENGTIPKSGQTEYVGNSNPRWSLGWINHFTYRNFDLDLQINGKFGGKVISQTEAMLDFYGVSERSADARDRGYVPIDAVLPDGTAVDRIDPKRYYSTVGDRSGIKEMYTYNRTNIRLSSVMMSYRLNFERARIKELRVSLVGQNLFFMYRHAPFDPEVTLNTLIADQAIDSFSVPATRSFGVSFRLGF